MTRNSQIIINFLVYLLAFLIAPTELSAEEVKLRSENFTHLTIEDGLPQNNVRCIEEDQYGFLWLCTADGLVRYDGYEFELVTEGTDGSRISNTVVRTILADGDNLWIGTENGLNRFDLDKGIFENINLYLDDMKKIKHVRSLLKVAGSELWVGTREGIIKLDYSDNSRIVTSVNSTINARDMTMYKNRVIVADYGKGLVEINLLSNNVLREKELLGKRANNIVNINVYNNKVYISTYGNGLSILDLNFDLIKHLELCEVNSSDCLSSNYVFFAKEYNNQIWIGSQKGINILDTVSDESIKGIRLTSFIRNKYISDSIISAHFTGSSLWFGLGPGGLVKYKLSLDGINYYLTKHDANKALHSTSDRSVFAIAKSNKSIFAGTYNGLYRVNPKSNTLDPLESVNAKLGESSLRISSMCLKSESMLLFATSGGLYNFNLTTKALDKIVIPNGNNEYIKYINCIKNNVFVSTDKGNIYTYDIENTLFTLRIKNHNNYIVNAIYAEDDAIYLSTYSGLAVYKIHSNTVVEKRVILSSSLITKGVPYQSKILIGTQGNGLFVWDKLEEKLTKVPLAYQTIGNSIYDISIINDHAWLSTNNGIIQLDLKSFSYSHFVQSHGLADKEYNIGALLYDEQLNTLFAGGLIGLTSINIDSVESISSEKRNIISKISVVDRNGLEIRNYFNIPSLINLDEGNSLLIQLGNKYASIRFKSDFNYTLDKFTSSVTTTLRPNQRQISLVDISNGDFELFIENSDQYLLKINVKPYIWKRWWALIIYIILLYLLIRKLTNHLREIQEAKAREAFSNKELDLKRKQLASLSHELRTPLNAIIGITDASNSKDVELLNIKSSAYLLRSLIDNALDSISLEVSDFVNLTEESFNIKNVLDDVINILNLYINASNINVSIIIEKNISTYIVSDKLKILQVLINLVKNALKHSISATELIINIYLLENSLCISISDNGVGINYSEQKSIFDVFYKVDNKKSGFGLGLYISKRICQALGGDLLLDSEPRKGSTFTIKIPYKVSEIDENVKHVAEPKRKQKVRSILILEDDPLNIYALKLLFKKLKFSSYHIVDNYSSFISENMYNYDCVILDLNFGHEIYNGIDLAKSMHKENYKGLIYILTAESDLTIKANAMRYVVDYIVKPITSKEIENIIFSDDFEKIDAVKYGTKSLGQ